MSRIGHKIFKQRNIGQQWGIFAQVATQVMIFVGMLNLLLLAVTAYNTTLAEWLMEFGIYMRFWVFIAIIAGFLLVASVLLYKFALPSFYDFWNDQFYRHNNPLRRDIELLKEDNREILKRLKELEPKEPEKK